MTQIIPYFWHCLDHLVNSECYLNIAAYLSIDADHLHPFMTPVYSSSEGWFQEKNTPRHKIQIISDWFLKHEWMFCESCWVLVLSSPSYLTLFLRSLPLWWLLVCSEMLLWSTLRSISPWALLLCVASISHMLFQYFSVCSLGGAVLILVPCHWE